MQPMIYVEGMKPGHGINVLTGDVLPSIAVNGSLTSIPEAHGQVVTSKFVRIDDISSLHTSLGIDVTADGSYAGFSGNAKVQFADTCNFNSHSTYILIHIEVKNAFLSMDDPVLTPDANELIRNQNQQQFRDRFGDVFITGISTGGEYFAIYQVSGTDEKVKEEAATAVHAAYEAPLVADVHLGVTIDKLRESSQSHLEVRAFAFQSGGSDTSMAITPDEIMAKARSFGPSVRDEFAVPYSMLPASYRALKLPDDAANAIDLANQREALADAWKMRNDLLVLKNDIDYVLLSTAQNHHEFVAFDVPALTDRAEQLDRSDQDDYEWGLIVHEGCPAVHVRQVRHLRDHPARAGAGADT